MAQHETTNGEGYKPREFTTILGENTILVRCDYRLEAQAEWLLETLKEIHAHDPIEEGTTVELGWSLITFVKDDAGRLVACEPDFSEEPFENVIADVTMTLHIVAEQGYIITHTKTEETAQIPRFDDTIILETGALEAEHIYLERSPREEDEDDEEEGSETDSGWFIGIVDEDADEDKEISEDDFEACYVYELIASRPELMNVLGLPPGYIVTFVRDEIETIIDENDNDVWNIEHKNGVA